MHDESVDDMTLDIIVTEQRADLVGQIWQYTLGLERYVVKLRNQINRLAMRAGDQLPYPDVASDFVMRGFMDHPAFHEFETELSAEDTNWPVPE
jgi:hypothetical protein